MNDPNGLVFYKGEYHLFYQYNPFGQVVGPHELGSRRERATCCTGSICLSRCAKRTAIMIFSGSAVVDSRNSSGLCRPDGDDPSCLVAIYTGHTETLQTQNLAYSNDRGRTWTKYAGNPVIDLGPRGTFAIPRCSGTSPPGAGSW